MYRLREDSSVTSVPSQCFNNISAAVRQPQTAKPRVAKQPHPVAGQGEATKGPEQRHSATLCRNSWLPPQWPLYEVGVVTVVANSNKNPVSCHPGNNLTSHIFLWINAKKTRHTRSGLEKIEQALN